MYQGNSVGRGSNQDNTRQRQASNHCAMMAQYTLTQYVLYVHVQTQKPGYEATYIIITSLTHIAYVLKA